MNDNDDRIDRGLFRGWHEANVGCVLFAALLGFLVVVCAELWLGR